MTIHKLEKIQLRYISNVAKILPLKYDFLIMDENAEYRICATIANTFKTLNLPLKFVNSHSIDDDLLDNTQFISDQSLDQAGNYMLCATGKQDNVNILIIIYLYSKLQAVEYKKLIKSLHNDTTKIEQPWLDHPNNFVFRRQITNNTIWGYPHFRKNKTSCYIRQKDKDYIRVNPQKRYKIK